MNLGRLVQLFGIALAIVLPVRFWVAEPIYIATASMEPTLPVGRHLILDRLSLKLRSARRGDIIVFRSPEGDDEEMVKRVIAVPGETVELREKKVFVNGQELDEPYVQHTRSAENLQGDTLGPVTVPAGALFVLGDNRDESRDSSVWKDASGGRSYFLPQSNVKGVVRGFYL